jgi:hypothetical protein
MSINPEQRPGYGRARQKAKMESGESQRRLGITQSNNANGSKTDDHLEASSAGTQALRHMILYLNIGDELRFVVE